MKPNNELFIPSAIRIFRMYINIWSISVVVYRILFSSSLSNQYSIHYITRSKVTWYCIGRIVTFDYLYLCAFYLLSLLLVITLCVFHCFCGSCVCVCVFVHFSMYVWATCTTQIVTQIYEQRIKGRTGNWA